MTPVETQTGSAPAAYESDLLPTDSHYLLTGELPTASEKPADSHVSETDKELERQEQELAQEHENQPTSDDPASSSRETAAEPRTAPTQKKLSRQERDWKRLSESNGRFQRENQELKDRLDAVEKRFSQPTTEVSDKPNSQPAKAEEKAAAKAKLKLTDNNPTTGKPFTSVEEWQDAREQQLRDELLGEVEGRQTKAQEQRTQAEQQKARAETEKVIAQEWGKRVESAREKYADFDDVALDPDLAIPQGSVLDIFTLTSPQGTDVLYHLGQNPAELERISKLNPIDQARELTKLELKFSKPAPAPKVSSAKRVTNAPPPPHEVSGKNTTSLDEAEKAVNDGDMEAYKATMNARDLKRRKGR